MNIHKIHDTTRKELEKYRGHWPEIARRADVSYNWVTKFVDGSTENPRVTETQRVINLLFKLKSGKIQLRQR